jgi:WD40 repeat protein
MWDLKSHQEVLRLSVGKSENADHMSVAFSPDGKQLAVTDKENTVTLWDTARGDKLSTLRGYTAPVVGLAFHPNGTQLATASEDGIRIWNVATGEEVLVPNRSEPVLTVVFSPDGRHLATGSADGTAVVWDVGTGRQLFTLFGHTRAVFSIAFTPDGSRLATASGDGTVKIWDAGDGKELLTLSGHTGRIFDLAISPDGARLATAGQDGVSRVYTLRLEDLVELARARVTRLLTPSECEKYLHMPECPLAP